MTTFATCVNCRHKWTYSGWFVLFLY
jgi:hypothetical protein